MITCNLIRIIPGILEGKFNKKYILNHFSYKINFTDIIEICIKIYATRKCVYETLCPQLYACI